MGFLIWVFGPVLSGPHLSPHRDPLGLVFKRLFKLMLAKFWQPLMNITYEIFSLCVRVIFAFFSS